MKQSKIPEKTSHYRSFVLRCWQVRTDHAGRETGVWRFSLQDPRTNQRRGFATLEALLVSLQAELADDDVDLERSVRDSRSKESLRKGMRE